MNPIKLVALFVVSLGLIACGSSDVSSSDTVGGNDVSSSDTSDASSSDTVGGIASKGILNGATITVAELVGTQWIDRGTATTASDGSYLATLADYTDGPVRVKVTSTSDTKMKCDAPSGCVAADGSAIVFGADVAIGRGVTLEAILPSKSADAHITPLTHLAAGRIVNTTGAIDSDSIRSVHLQVASSFGLPAILGVKPVDASSDASSASADEQQMALTVASVAEMMSSYDKDSDGTTSAVEFFDALEALRNDFKDGDFSTVADVTLGSESVFSAVFAEKEKLLFGADAEHTHFRTTFEMPESEITRAANATKVITDKITTAVRNNNAAITPVTPDLTNKTKVDLAKAIVSDVRTLVTSLDSSRDYFSPFKEKIEIAHTLASSKLDRHFEWFFSAAGVMSDHLLNNAEAVTNIPITIPGNPAVSATLTITEVDGGTKADITASASNTNPGIHVTFESNLSLTNSSAILSQLNLKVSGKVIEEDGSITTNLNNVSIDLALNNKMNLNAISKSAYKEFSMSGNINAVVAANGIEPKAEVHGLFFAAVVANNHFSSGSMVNWKRFMLNGKMMSGTQSMSGKLEFIASGDLTTLDRIAPESASNFIGGLLHLSLDTALSGYPNTDVLITFNRNQADTGEAIISVHQRDNGRSLVLNMGVTDILHVGVGAILSNGDLAKTLTVTSNDRTRLVLTQSDTSRVDGTVSVEGNTVATISNNIAHYPDGTFESVSY